MDANNILDAANGVTFGVWYLIGAVLVFFMQCGFAMVETGFTRAKNAGNIIMKNLMDFCIGTVVFSLLGFSLMMAEDYVFGLIGVPNLDIFTNYANFPWSSFVFNLVFAATAATIVSGAMAERTKFSAYCIYSAVISLLIYPVEAGWVWNPKGWLFKLGYIDFAGSTAIHMVGGMCALIGAAILGPRIGKYVKDSTGKVVKVNAIPGHSLTLGALGVFILWFAWYGFNGAAATSVGSLASILLTTTIAPAIATCVTMCFTWIKNGKPDVSMCLNGSLAGLVGVTAGCNNVDALGSAIIGIVSGILIVLVVEFFDIKLHIDDPVGAIGVHFANGIWGGLAAGLLSTKTVTGGVDGPIYAAIHGGDVAAGFKVFGVQVIGILAILAWTAATITVTFLIIKKINGLRTSAEEEIAGLDISEHGLISAYADFVPVIEDMSDYSVPSVSGTTPVAEAVEIKEMPSVACDTKMTKVEIICKERMLEPLKASLLAIGITGMTVSHVMGCGIQKGKPEYYRGVEVEPSLLPKIQIDIVVSKVPVEQVIATAKRVLYTGHIGDGKIFVYNVEGVYKVRTGETNYAALQDVE